MHLLAALVFVLALGPAALMAQVDARLLREPAVSSSHIAFLYAGDLWVAPKAGGTAQRLTTAPGDEHYPRFSPDGRWLAYTLEQPNFHADLMLHDFDSGRAVQVSDGMADVASPAFDPEGKYLFFAASTNSGPLQVGLNMTSQERPYRAGLYAAVLAAADKSPLAPEAGDEEVKADDEEGKKDVELANKGHNSAMPTVDSRSSTPSRTSPVPARRMPPTSTTTA